MLIRNRRHFLSGLPAAAFAIPGVFAEVLRETEKQTEGPFYPDKLPLDTDNDLIRVNDSLTPSVGEITMLSGRILDRSGSPLRNVMVEIWQCDANGHYLHSGSNNKDKADKNFQGFGRFLTASNGEYLFRTIKPVDYDNRTAHIHYAIKSKGKRAFTTQCYMEGHPTNAKDGILKKITDQKARATLIVPFHKQSSGIYSAKFDIVLGFTPELT